VNLHSRSSVARATPATVWPLKIGRMQSRLERRNVELLGAKHREGFLGSWQEWFLDIGDVARVDRGVQRSFLKCYMCLMARPREFDTDLALDGAVAVFREHGFEGTSAQMLVDAMGIGRQSLYAAFGDKWQLCCSAARRERGWRRGSCSPRFAGCA
jgi:Bacterial regulatory proteins, tetR family